MTRELYSLSTRLQEQLLRAASSLPAETWARDVPRVLLDSWASLVRWHEAGEKVWRISAAAADETGDMLLPSDLPLATARVRAEAVCYQLPDRAQWIIVARHAPAPLAVTVSRSAPHACRGATASGYLGWAYRQPVLTYCSEIDGRLASGYYSLADYPTAGQLPLTLAPGHVYGPSGARPLGDGEAVEDDARFALALLHHYLP